MLVGQKNIIVSFPFVCVFVFFCLFVFLLSVYTYILRLYVNLFFLKKGVFWLHSRCFLVPSNSKETELGSSDQEASPSAGKNTGVVLMPCSHMEVRPYSYFWWCQYLWGPWVSFLTTDELSVGVTKVQGLVSHELAAYLSIFNLFKLNKLWPYCQKHANKIILNHRTLWRLALQIFEAFVVANLSLNQTPQTFLLCVRQTSMTQLILAISLWEVIFL